MTAITQFFTLTFTLQAWTRVREIFFKNEEIENRQKQRERPSTERIDDRLKIFILQERKNIRISFSSILLKINEISGSYQKDTDLLNIHNKVYKSIFSTFANNHIFNE